jgi:ELWxxDGT repeat protein
MIKDINSIAGSDPSFLTVVNGVLYFTANDGINGTELWKTDGTAEGTVIVKNINTGANNSNPALLTNINGTLYFIANNGTEGTELWKSDGTEAGTILVKDINAGINGSNPVSLTNLHGTIFFTADNGSAGRELWKSDGTDAGTILIKDINVGGSSDPERLTKVANTIMFTANDGISGNEVWISNGTEAGTRMAPEIEPGPGGSNPTEIFEYGAKVLVAATNSTTGSEVWIADVPSDPLPLELLEFKGFVVNNDGLLQWKTENETNTSSFIVERSIDGRNYKSVGSVTAANTPGVHYYDFTDLNITSLGVPNIYYRLRSTDIDGRYTYSNIVILSVDYNGPIVLLYPNPVSDMINMTIAISQNEKLQWQLIDNSGRTVKSGIYHVTSGSTAFSLDVSALSKGLYFMQLKSSSLQRVIKVIKQ